MENNIGIICKCSPKMMEKLINGDEKIGVGGVRRSDGTMLEMFKPISSKDALINFKHFKDGEKALFKVTELKNEVDLSKYEISEIKNTLFYQMLLVNSMFSTSFDAFNKSIELLNDICSKINSLDDLIHRQRIQDLYEKTERLFGQLVSDIDLLIDNSLDNSIIITINDHLNETRSFLLEQFNIINQETGKYEQVFVYSVLKLLTPYSFLIRKYCALYYYKYCREHSMYKRWAEIIDYLVDNEKIKDLFEFYFRTQVDLSYKDQLSLSKEMMQVAKKQKYYLELEQKYIKFHTEKEYNDAINCLSDNADVVYYLIDDL